MIKKIKIKKARRLLGCFKYVETIEKLSQPNAVVNLGGVIKLTDECLRGLSRICHMDGISVNN